MIQLAMRHAKLVAALSLISVPAALSGQGTLSGLVVDTDGKPITGATVVWTRAGEGDGRFARDHDRSTWSGQAFAENGTFSFDGLTPGKYHLCTEGTALEHVSTCVWYTLRKTVEVDTFNSVVNVTLILGTGRLLRVSVADPNGQISDKSPFRVIAASAQGPFAHARLLSRSATHSEFTIAVPADHAIRLMIDTPLRVTDAYGQPVPTGVPSIDVGVEPTAPPVRLTVN